MHLYIVCGHGAGDSGAVGSGDTEARVVRVVGSRLAQMGGASVTLLDQSRNWYADYGLKDYGFSPDAQVVELHMDAATPSARGGHVLIKPGLSPDAYDSALAAFIGGFTPGRSQTVVGQQLANASRCAARGVGYRLLECGFITNSEDYDRVINGVDELCAGILSAFGVGSDSGAPATSSDADAAGGDESGDKSLALDGKFEYYTKLATQEWLRSVGTYGYGLALDGDFGSYSYTALQEYLRQTGDYGPGLAIDGVGGTYTAQALQEFLRREGTYGDGLAIDGSWGHYTTLALQEFLRARGFYN
jgi:hypothetical protein